MSTVNKKLSNSTAPYSSAQSPSVRGVATCHLSMVLDIVFTRITTHIPKLSPDVISSNDGSAAGHGPITCQDAERGRLASTCIMHNVQINDDVISSVQHSKLLLVDQPHTANTW